MSSRRFERQIRFAPLGAEGQARIEAASVTLVGCGALGGVIAQTLTRSGVGLLRLVDRDVVEETNLPRQVLFEDRHAEAGTTKVEAARETLERIGGPTRFETHLTHFDARNAEELAAGADLILDGTDNLATRYVINDLCVRERRPWIYGGVVGGGGLALAVVPHVGACLRCLFPEPPPPGSLPTCETAGVLLPAVGAVASIQSGLALRLLTSPESFEPALIETDVWTGEVRRLRATRRSGCPTCDEGEFPFLEDGSRPALVFCGRNAVQVRGPGRDPDLDRLARSIAPLATSFKRAGPFLRFAVDGHTLTVFPDGRALVEGTEDVDRALALYDRYVGS